MQAALKGVIQSGPRPAPADERPMIVAEVDGQRLVIDNRGSGKAFDLRPQLDRAGRHVTVLLDDLTVDELPAGAEVSSTYVVGCW